MGARVKFAPSLTRGSATVRVDHRPVSRTSARCRTRSSTARGPPSKSSRGFRREDAARVAPFLQRRGDRAGVDARDALDCRRRGALATRALATARRTVRGRRRATTRATRVRRHRTTRPRSGPARRSVRLRQGAPPRTTRTRGAKPRRERANASGQRAPTAQKEHTHGCTRGFASGCRAANSAGRSTARPAALLDILETRSPRARCLALDVRRLRPRRQRSAFRARRTRRSAGSAVRACVEKTQRDAERPVTARIEFEGTESLSCCAAVPAIEKRRTHVSTSRAAPPDRRPADPFLEGSRVRVAWRAGARGAGDRKSKPARVGAESVHKGRSACGAGSSTRPTPFPPPIDARIEDSRSIPHHRMGIPPHTYPPMGMPPRTPPPIPPMGRP